MKLKAIIHRAEEEGFRAEVPALRGCVSEGDTLEEAIANIREATEGWLEIANSVKYKNFSTRHVYDRNNFRYL
jgi:predicted RNase H-like HicB family nuclease